MWSLLLFALLISMYQGGHHGGGHDDNAPVWGPGGSLTFQRWLQHVQAWVNVTSGRMTPTAQAAAIQIGLRGVASDFAFELPPEAISQGALINNVMVDPVTYLIFQLGLRFQAFDEEIILAHSTAIIDFTGRAGENIDTTIIRFDMARQL